MELNARLHSNCCEIGFGNTVVVWFLSGNFIDDGHAAQLDILGNSAAVVAIVLLQTWW